MKDSALSNMKAGNTDSFALMKDLVGKFGQLEWKADADGQVVQTVKNFKDITDALAAAQAEYKDLSIAMVRDADKAFDALNEKFIESLNRRTTLYNNPSKLTKMEEKQFGMRASDVQKENRTDLKADLEDLQEKIDKEKELAKIQAEKEIAQFKSKREANPRDALERAQISGNADAIREADAEFKAAQQDVADFIEKTRANLLKNPVFEPMLDQADELVQKIKDIEKTALGQNSRKDRDDLDANSLARS